MDNRGVGQKELYRHNTALRAEYSFVKALNSHACQVAVEWAYTSIARFYDSCKQQISGKKGYPKFKKNCRSVEYKTSGWSLSETRKQITFTDKKYVSGKIEDMQIAVQIRDTGPGISEQDLPHIFEQFYTTDRSRSGSGTGLGLAIAQRIVEAHGGSITASSTPGQGAMFTICLAR